VPQRHATTALHYNEELLRERGLSGPPPTTIEELIEYAKRLTYTRAEARRSTASRSRASATSTW
jgi:multiple sugar transport system substrate-binding protein